MSRGATRWAYGSEVLGLKLSASELAILRAICWSIHPKNKRTKPLTQKELARLTQVTSPTTQNEAIERLKKLGLLARTRANQLPKKKDEPRLRSNAYVYSIPNMKNRTNSKDL